MIKILGLVGLTGLAMSVPARANDNTEYPATSPYYPFQRSYLSGEAVVIPPYRHPFAVRIYTTPQQQPYYNVPPYPVATPD